MKLVSWNVNGIRAVGRQHFLPWFEKEAADVVCVQEIKATPEQLDETQLHPLGYHSVWHPAEKPGYSGVAIFSKKEPVEVRNGIGIPEFDREGRVLCADFGKFVVLNCYFPNSQRDHSRLPYKLSFCQKFLKFSEGLRAKGKQLIICGDFNIAHKEIDLKNPKSNAKNAGFLPEERGWMDEFVKANYVDTFRKFDPGPDHYTWWSYRPGVRAKNIGWRLDYFFVNSEHADRLKSSQHRCEVMGSDHCPVVLELKG
jgi:exodeoxyribonuclease III